MALLSALLSEPTSQDWSWHCNPGASRRGPSVASKFPHSIALGLLRLLEAQSPHTNHPADKAGRMDFSGLDVKSLWHFCCIVFGDELVTVHSDSSSRKGYRLLLSKNLYPQKGRTSTFGSSHPEAH